MTPAATTPPSPQHLQALARANAVRLARAELKRRVGDAETTVGEVVLECPWEAETMTVADLLMTQRRWGRTRCRKLLQSIPVSETKTVGALTDRQRHAIVDALARHGADSGTAASRTALLDPVLA
jgi:hypothetical protein